MEQLYRITWHLTGNRRIEKIGAGEQQCFVYMSRQERAAITTDCLKVTKVPYFGKPSKRDDIKK